MERAPLTKEEWLALEKKANDLRHLCLQTTVWAGSGHIGGGMSVMDILTVMYHRYLNIKKEDPKWEDRDRFILSKGHAGIAYAPCFVISAIMIPSSSRPLTLQIPRWVSILTQIRLRA